MSQEEKRCMFKTCSSSFTPWRRRLRRERASVSQEEKKREREGEREGDRGWKVTQQGVRDLHWL